MSHRARQPASTFCLAYTMNDNVYYVKCKKRIGQCISGLIPTGEVKVSAAHEGNLSAPRAKHAFERPPTLKSSQHQWPLLMEWVFSSRLGHLLIIRTPNYGLRSF